MKSKCRLTKNSYAFSFLVITCLLHQAAAQVPNSEAAGIQIPIEEIVVIGQKSTYTMRVEIRKLDREIYDQLNSLIEDEYYQVTCSRPTRVSARTRPYRCQTGFELMARRIAYSEASALAALGEISLGTFTNDDTLFSTQEISTQETVALTESRGFLINSFADIDAVMLTELQRGREEYPNIVFDLAKDRPQLAEKLVRRYFLNLALQHRKKHWWSNLFGREVAPMPIPNSVIRLIK